MEWRYTKGMEYQDECERCNKIINITIYTEEIGDVERHYDCPYCNFHRHWAYGHYAPEDSEFIEMEFPDKIVKMHMDDNNIPIGQQFKILSRKSKKAEYVYKDMLNY